MSVTRLFPRSIRFLCLLASFTFAAGVHADSLREASQLLKEGHAAEALGRIDQFLQTKPKDAQGRFLKGLILSDLNRQQDAIAEFTGLTQDYPELPEPYNNLAVIYAQQKHYEKAKEELEMAIRTHPSYATAHENLGDIYARLASQAYDKALQLDSANAGAQAKLAMIRELISMNNRAVAAKAPAEAPVAKATEKPASVAAAGEETSPVELTPLTQPAAPVASVSAGESLLSGEIASMIQAWSSAWSRKDVKAYLGFYARDFATPGNVRRANWEKQRRDRIDRPGSISVTFENLRVAADKGNRAVAKFRQHYQSAAIRTSSNKVLVLVKHEGKWQIQQERVGN